MITSGATVNVFMFWDGRNDESMILDEEGEFWFFSEDKVAVKRGLPDEECRRWMYLNKILDPTPLNSEACQYEILNWKTGEWVSYCSAPAYLRRKVQRHVGAKNWREVY